MKNTAILLFVLVIFALSSFYIPTQAQATDPGFTPTAASCQLMTKESLKKAREAKKTQKKTRRIPYGVIAFIVIGLIFITRYGFRTRWYRRGNTMDKISHVVGQKMDDQ